MSTFVEPEIAQSRVHCNTQIARKFSPRSAPYRHSRNLEQQRPGSPLVSRREKTATSLRLLASTVYAHLLMLVCSANLIALLAISLGSHRSAASLPCDAATAITANLAVAIAIRQDYIVNCLFAICRNVPHSAPLSVRKRLAKVYENGGAHAGAAVSAMVWSAILLAAAIRQQIQGESGSLPVLCLSSALFVCLLLIIVASLPQLRFKHHNVFENIHRVGGWTCVMLSWPTLVFLLRQQARDNSVHNRMLGNLVLRAPAFWLLNIISIHVLYPWLLLRKMAVVKHERLSDHALRVYFSGRERMQPLRTIALSSVPLREWHSFAVLSGEGSIAGGSRSCIVSNAGDWTSSVTRQPPSHFYTRGLPKAGVLETAMAFRSIVLMATGSGIAPCLATLGQLPETKIRLIWSAPNPMETFGKSIMDLVMQLDSEALIHNTRVDPSQRPDLVQMACDAYDGEEAEAVFFISNRKLTQVIVKELKAKEIPTFAPIFDS